VASDDRPAAHLPLRRLADLVDGKLSAARAAQVAEHLAGGCAECAAREEALRRTLGAMRAGPLPAPPRRLVRRAALAFAETRVVAAIAAAGRIMARLVFDARTAGTLALRAAPGAERRLLWNVGGFDVDACIVTGERASDLLGQVVREDGEDAPLAGHVSACRRGASLRTALAADGRFVIRGIGAGTWTLVGRVGRLEFAVPPFVVEQAG
jgi:hypothetical protein